MCVLVHHNNISVTSIKKIKNEKRSRNGTGQKSNESRNVTCCSHNNYMLNVFYLMIQYQGERGLIEGHAYSVLLLPIYYSTYT